MKLAAAKLLVAAVFATPGAASSGARSDAAEELGSLQLLQHAATTEKREGAERPFRCAPIEKIWDESGRYQKAGFCGTYPNPVMYDKEKWYPGSPAEADLFRPLVEVRMDHLYDDLYEHFGYLNDWINPWSSAYTIQEPDPAPSSTQNANKSIGYEAIKKKMMTSVGDKYPDPIEMTFKWDGHEIHTRQDHICQTGDDPYCYANGWMKNQNSQLNASVFDDIEKFSVFAAKQCGAMQEKYNFSNDEVTMLNHLQETNTMYELTDNACDKMEKKGPLPTDRDYAKHAYTKCIMNVAMIEIPYCYFRGCALENNRIGHGNECDY